MAGANVVWCAQQFVSTQTKLLCQPNWPGSWQICRKVPAFGSFLAVDWAFMNCHLPPLWFYLFPYCSFLLESRMILDFLHQVSSFANSSSVLLWVFYFYFSTCMSQWPMLTASQELTETATAQHELPFVKTGARACVGPLCTCILILST